MFEQVACFGRRCVEVRLASGPAPPETQVPDGDRSCEEECKAADNAADDGPNRDAGRFGDGRVRACTSLSGKDRGQKRLCGRQRPAI